MTNTTTATSRSAIIISWTIAIIIYAGFALMLWLIPGPRNGILHLPDKNHQNPQRSSRRMKQEQSHHPLPQKYTRQLVQQSEVQVKKNLESRLTNFKEMSQKMRTQKDQLLDQVEARKLPPSAPADANNTSAARNIPRAGDPPLSAHPSVKEIYEMLKQYENEIQQNHLAVTAAKRSLSKGLSFPEVYRAMQSGLSQMPSFDELIQNQTGGKEWDRSAGSYASAGLQIKDIADLNNYRELLGQASRQAGLAGARLQSLFGIAGQGKGKGGGGSPQGGGGSGGGNGGLSVNFTNHARKGTMSYYQGARLNGETVKAQALPGRRFSKTAARKGWLYVNTWYMIGPWESYGREDYAITHPPEVSIDLDAVYTDGQTGTGIIETDADPLKMIGKEVVLDGTLRWKFMQSASMYNTVPVTTDHSTYYAYTELYFDETTTMLVAVGTDDGGRVWINGKDVWQDKGTSWYHIDEHIVPFEFRQGWNRVLVRLENSGGGPAGFSFLICPKEAVNSAMADK